MYRGDRILLITLLAAILCQPGLAQSPQSGPETEDIDGKDHPERIPDTRALNSLLFSVSDYKGNPDHAFRAGYCREQGLIGDDMEIVITFANRYLAYRLESNRKIKIMKKRIPRPDPSEYAAMNEELLDFVDKLNGELQDALGPEGYGKLKACLEKTVKPTMTLTVPKGMILAR